MRRLTDQERQPVRPEGAAEDDEEKPQSQHKRQEDDGWSGQPTREVQHRFRVAMMRCGQKSNREIVVQSQSDELRREQIVFHVSSGEGK